MGESNAPTLAGVFDGPSLRALLVQREMGSCRVVVSEVGAQEPFEMAVVVDDHVIDALASDRANQTLDIGILPGRARGGEHLFDCEAAYPAAKLGAIDFVAVVQEITRCLLPGKRLNHLLSRPPACGVFGDVEVDDLPTLETQNEEYVQNSKSERRDGEKVDA